MSVDARGAAQDRARLLLEDARHVAGAVDVVVVAARRVGHPLHQQLVVLHAEADGRDRDAVLGGARGDARQLAGAGDADVGLAVGEQHDLVDLPGLEGAEHLGQAGQQAAAEVRAAAVDERADAGDHQVARVAVDDDRRRRQVDAVENATTDTRSPSRSWPTNVSAAISMLRNGSPCIEPERSRTSATLSGASAAAGGRPLHADGGVELPGRQPRPDAAGDVDRRGLGIVGLRRGPLGRRRHREHLPFAEIRQARRLRQADEDGAPGRGERHGERAPSSSGMSSLRVSMARQNNRNRPWRRESGSMPAHDIGTAIACGRGAVAGLATAASRAAATRAAPTSSSAPGPTRAAITPNCIGRQRRARSISTGETVTITKTDSSHVSVALGTLCTVTFNVDGSTATAVAARPARSTSRASARRQPRSRSGR